MKKLALIAAAGMLAMSGAAFADPGTHTNNGNDANKNCFGQARSADASGQTIVVSGPGYKNEGQILSQRKGNNSTENAQFKQDCQTPN